MNLTSAITTVNKKFEYREDKKSFYDHWYVMKEQNGKMYGDCEDYALTVFWYLSNQSLIKFLWNLLVTHRYKVHRVMSSNGYHIVGEYQHQWFDNWTLEAFDKQEFFHQTKHQHLYRYWSPGFILYLILGIFYR